MSRIYDQLKTKYNKLGLSRTELAKELGISLPTLDRMLSKGDPLPAYKKVGRQYLFLLENVAAFFDVEQENRDMEEEENG